MCIRDRCKVAEGAAEAAEVVAKLAVATADAATTVRNLAKRKRLGVWEDCGVMIAAGVLVAAEVFGEAKRRRRYRH